MRAAPSSSIKGRERVYSLGSFFEEGLRISPVSGEILRIGGFAPVLLDALLSIVVWEHRGMFGVLSGTGNLLGYGVPVSRKAGSRGLGPLAGVWG